MRIRPYRSKDLDYLKTWIKDKREHALWCADILDYPITQEVMEKERLQMDAKSDGSMFTAIDKNGIPMGFFSVMRVDFDMNNAHLGFIIIDPALRGNGYGREMVTRAVNYCFIMLEVTSITLKVYESNESAHKCYKAVGFADVLHNDKSFEFEDEKWGTWDMIITSRKQPRPTPYF